MSDTRTRPPRVLVAKPGLDGHDRGAKIVARALSDAGMEVIYSGLRRRPEDIVVTAVQEDVDLVGLSVLSGSHVSLAERVIDALEAEGAGDVPVVVGGVIPDEDVPALEALGVAATFPGESDADDIVATVRDIIGGEDDEHPRA